VGFTAASPLASALRSSARSGRIAPCDATRGSSLLVQLVYEVLEVGAADRCELRAAEDGPDPDPKALLIGANGARLVRIARAVTRISPRSAASTHSAETSLRVHPSEARSVPALRATAAS
jgi:hypothetical protein